MHLKILLAYICSAKQGVWIQVRYIENAIESDRGYNSIRKLASKFDSSKPWAGSQVRSAVLTGYIDNKNINNQQINQE
jgi:hypothetical protein